MAGSVEAFELIFTACRIGMSFRTPSEHTELALINVFVKAISRTFDSCGLGTALLLAKAFNGLTNDTQKRIRLDFYSGADRDSSWEQSSSRFDAFAG
jgi:hypothetical protein